MASSSTINATIKASSALQKHLQSNPNLLSTLRSSSCLLITSSPPAHNPYAEEPKINNHIQSTTSTFTGRYNLRTSTPLTLSSAYPTTPNDVQKLTKMMNRVGSDVVIGIGSGSAIDLAKCCSTTTTTETTSVMKELVLMPSTCGGAMAAGSSHALLLDEKEEILVSPSSSIKVPRTVIIDTKAAVVPTPYDAKKKSSSGLAKVQDVAYASLALCFEASFRSMEDDDRDSVDVSILQQVVEKSLLILDQLKQQEEGDPTAITTIQQNAMEASFLAGQLISFGTYNQKRTIPLALASALLPQYFPKGNLLSFYASLLPGLCAMHDQINNSASSLPILQDMLTSNDSTTYTEWCQTLTKDVSCTKLTTLAMDTPTVYELMKQVNSNQTLLLEDVEDVEDEVLEFVLHSSLNR